MVEDEKRLGFTIDNNKSLKEYVENATSCVCRDDKKALDSLITGIYDIRDVYTTEWKYPAGVFHGADGDSC